MRARRAGERHDIAEGGFLVAVAECCLAGGIGAELDRGPGDDPLLHLFGEGPGRASWCRAPREALDRLAQRTPLDVFGTVGGESLRKGAGIEVSLDDLRAAHGSLAAAFA